MTTLPRFSEPNVNRVTIKKECYKFIVNNVITNMEGHMFILHADLLSDGYVLRILESVYSYTSSNSVIFLKFKIVI